MFCVVCGCGVGFLVCVVVGCVVCWFLVVCVGFFWFLGWLFVVCCWWWFSGISFG